MSGTFANIRLRNRLVDREGGWTEFHLRKDTSLKMPAEESRFTMQPCSMQKTMSADSSCRKRIRNRQFKGLGSQRHVPARSQSRNRRVFRTLHTSDLSIGVLPLQFKKGENANTPRPHRKRSYEIPGIENMEPHGELTVTAKDENGDEVQFQVILRLDSPVEIEYYLNGGILHKFLSDSVKKK